MSEPREITIGSRATWSRSWSDYPAPAWVLTYYLLNPDRQLVIVAAADGEAHEVDVLPAAQGAWVAGDYLMTGAVANAATGDRRTVVDRVPLTLLPDPATLTSGHDQRGHVQRVLDALTAVIEGKATHDQLSYSVEGVSIARMSPTELLAFRDRYVLLRQNELARERRAAGKRGKRSTILARFPGR